MIDGREHGITTGFDLSDSVPDGLELFDEVL